MIRSPSSRNRSRFHKNPSPSCKNHSQSRENPSPSRKKTSPSRKNPSPSRRNPSPSHRNPSPNHRNPSPSHKRTSPICKNPTPKLRKDVYSSRKRLVDIERKLLSLKQRSPSSEKMLNKSAIPGIVDTPQLSHHSPAPAIYETKSPLQSDTEKVSSPRSLKQKVPNPEIASSLVANSTLSHEKSLEISQNKTPQKGENRNRSRSKSLERSGSKIESFSIPSTPSCTPIKALLASYKPGSRTRSPSRSLWSPPSSAGSLCSTPGKIFPGEIEI